MTAYASSSDLPAGVTTGVPSGVVTSELEAASRKVDMYTKAQYGGIDPSNVPLEVKKWVLAIAHWEIISGYRGVNSDDPAIAAIAKRSDDAMKELTLLNKGVISFSVSDATPLEDEGAPIVDTAQKRGW